MKIISKRGRDKNQLTRYTPSAAECKEMLRCMKDPVYFIENYVQIDTMNGLQLMKLTPEQLELISAVETGNNVLTRMARQSGSTTAAMAFLLWETIFNQHHVALSLGLNSSASTDMAHRFRAMLNHLPEFMKPKITYNQKDKIQFETGSMIAFTTFESYASGRWRGLSLSRVYMDALSCASQRIQNAIYSEVHVMVAYRAKVWIGSSFETS